MQFPPVTLPNNPANNGQMVSWAAALRSALITPFQALFNILNNGITFKDNVAVGIKVITVLGGFTSPIKFIPTTTTVEALWVGRITPENPNLVFAPSSIWPLWRHVAGSIEIPFISGLVPGQAYTITFVYIGNNV